MWTTAECTCVCFVNVTVYSSQHTEHNCCSMCSLCYTFVLKLTLYVYVMFRLLEKCPKLQLLDISFCYKITDETVRVWRANYPHVNIKRSYQKDADAWRHGTGVIRKHTVSYISCGLSAAMCTIIDVSMTVRFSRCSGSRLSPVCIIG